MGPVLNLLVKTGGGVKDGPADGRDCAGTNRRYDA